MNTLLLALLCLATYGIVVYNKLVTAKNHNREAWSGIDVQLKRRHDLVPNLVAAVKAYSDHEKIVLERVVKARFQAAATKSENVSARAIVEGELSHAISHVFVLVEDYPVLQADKVFTELHKNLVDIEDYIQMARRFYNGTCRDLNIAIQRFPSNLVAKLAGFEEAIFFEFKQSGEAVNVTL